MRNIEIVTRLSLVFLTDIVEETYCEEQGDNLALRGSHASMKRWDKCWYADG